MACYSESNLATIKVDLSKKSNNRINKKSNPSGKIERIIIHHMAGVMTAEECAKMHRDNDKKQSANYYIGLGGEIAEGVPESRRAWTSGSATADYKAITIEVSNSEASDPWPVSQESFNSLVNLCADICKRNGFEKLTYTGGYDGNLQCHDMWQKTICPGPYLKKRLPKLAQLVNDKLKAPEPDPEYYLVKRGDTLTKICLMYDTTIAQLVRLNSIKNINRIYVGQKLRVR